MTLVVLCLGACMFAGYRMRTYAAVILLLLLPLWDAHTGSTTGDLGETWKLDLIFVLPVGVPLVAVAAFVGRRHARARNRLS